MIRAIFKDLKAELSRLAGANGFAVTDPEFLSRFNKATQELMDAGDWPGVVDRYGFVAYDGNITLPGDLERLMGIAIGGVGVELRSPWFEFVQFGPGPQSEFSGMDAVFERGESAVFRDIPADGGGPYTLRIKSRIDERIGGVRPKIRILGYDTNGHWVRTENVAQPFDGVDVEIAGDLPSGYIETDFTWSKVEAVIKPVTKSYVELWANNSATVGEFMIASYAPRETNPSYRRYFASNIPAGPGVNVIVRARRRFIPITSDDDFLTITNINALECMLKALQHREVNDWSSYANAESAAVRLLTKEALAYRGKTIGPVITFGRGFINASTTHVQ